MLLKLLNAGSDIGPLVSEGLTYSQITQLLGELISDRLVALVDGAPVLTEAGLDAMREDELTGARRHDGGFISPLQSARIDRRSVDAIYLPRVRNSFF